MGGPPAFVSVLLGLLLAGCSRGPPGAPTPTIDTVAGRPLETYRDLGFVVGTAEFPAVLDAVTIAGPADSTYLLLSMSLPNSALRFQRDAAGFMASYDVAAEFRRDGVTARRFTRREAVHVSGFAETGRTEESVIFQQAVLLAPGRYELEFRASADGERTFEALDTLDVPAYGPASRQLAGPLILYEGRGRGTRDALPALILNARHTVAYGGEEPKLYVEWYGGGDAVPLTVRVLDERNATVQTLDATLPASDAEVRTTQIELAASSLPLGRVWLEVSRSGGATLGRAPLIVSISDQWLVASFDEVLQFLRYIATEAEMDELDEGSPQQRRQRWEEFWQRRDPVVATPANEFRDAFFDRVRHATEEFGDAAGLPGWRTDRGEVYIVLGPPDLEQERHVGRTDLARPNAIEWIYDSHPGGRLTLLFYDRVGIGRYELTPTSAAAFRTLAERLRTEVR